MHSDARLLGAAADNWSCEMGLLDNPTQGSQIRRDLAFSSATIPWKRIQQKLLLAVSLSQRDLSVIGPRYLGL
jgi:hypothetical protein